jgi:hypothetical protein
VKFSNEVLERILAALKRRFPLLPECPLCGQRNWQVNSGGFVFVPLQQDSTNVVIGGPQMPCVALICMTCGNTHLLNLIVLGLKEEDLA